VTLGITAKNTLANMAGRLASALVSLLLVPVYVKLLGMEAWGLVGFYSTLVTMFSILDLGLSAAINREVAGNRALHLAPEVTRDALRTYESFYWGIGVVAGAVIALVAPWVASEWFNLELLANDEVAVAVRLMGLCFAVQWPISLYGGVLRGGERQVLLNGIMVASVTVRALGAIILIAFVSRSVLMFFGAQTVGYLLEMLAVRAAAWCSLPAKTAGRPRLDLSVIKRTWRFALGYNLVGVTTAACSALPQIMVSTMLPLAALGSLNVASTVSGALTLVAYSVGSAVFPRFAGSQAKQDYEQTSFYYHKSLQATAYAVLGIAMVLAFVPRTVLTLWLADADTASSVAPVVQVMVISALFTSLANPAYTAITASGHMRVPIIVNVLSLTAMALGLSLTLPSHGVVTAAMFVAAYNLARFITFSASVRRTIHQSAVRALGKDIAVYAGVGLLVGISVFSIVSIITNVWYELLLMVLLLGAYFAIAGLTACKMRLFPYDVLKIASRDYVD